LRKKNRGRLILLIAAIFLASAVYLTMSGAVGDTGIFSKVTITGSDGSTRSLSTVKTTLSGLKLIRLDLIQTGTSTLYDSSAPSDVGNIRTDAYANVKVTSGRPLSWTISSTMELLIDGQSKMSVPSSTSGNGAPPSNINFNSLTRLGSQLWSDFGASPVTAPKTHEFLVRVSGSIAVKFAENNAIITKTFANDKFVQLTITQNPLTPSYDITVSSNPTTTAGSKTTTTPSTTGDSLRLRLMQGTPVWSDEAGGGYVFQGHYDQNWAWVTDLVPATGVSITLTPDNDPCSGDQRIWGSYVHPHYLESYGGYYDLSKIGVSPSTLTGTSDSSGYISWTGLTVTYGTAYIPANFPPGSTLPARYEDIYPQFKGVAASYVAPTNSYKVPYVRITMMKGYNDVSILLNEVSGLSSESIIPFSFTFSPKG
jgi:hypothetical protein